MLYSNPAQESSIALRQIKANLVEVSLFLLICRKNLQQTGVYFVCSDVTVTTEIINQTTGGLIQLRICFRLAHDRRQ
jgi:hypothetical protein